MNSILKMTDEMEKDLSAKRLINALTEWAEYAKPINIKALLEGTGDLI